MKKQLRNMMLAGAATMMAGNAWAQDAGSVDQIADGYSMKIEWEQPTPWGLAEGRFATAIKGSNEILVANNAQKEFWSFTAEGAKVAVSAIPTTPFAITCDEAGNIIFNKGGGAAAGGTDFYILPAGDRDIANVQTLNLTLPEGVADAGRVDQLGRVLGDVLSADGGWMTTVMNGAAAIGSYKIAEGELIDVYASLTPPVALNTFCMSQPWGTTVEECENASDPSMAIYLQGANVNKIYGPNADFDGWEGYDRQSHGSSYGFDWFMLGEETYFVYGGRRSDRTGSAWNCGDFFVVRASDNAVVGAYKATKEVASGQSFGSIIAYANEDGKSATIYRWNSCSGAAQVTFTVGGEVPPTPEPLYILGDQNNWDAAAPAEFVYDTENGVYTHKLVDAPYGFKISTAKGDWTAFDGAGFHIEGALAANTVTPLLEGKPADGNITLAMPGEYTLVVDLKNMTIEAQGTVVVTAPDQFFVIGELAVGSWDPSKGVELTKNGNIFEGDVAMTGGHFSFTEKLSTIAGNAGWSQLGQRYGAANNNQETHLNSPLPFMKGENSFDIWDYNEYPQNVHFVVDFENMTVTISTATGVEEVAIDAAVPAEYYNLQGIRVAQPEAGKLYIVKQGDKVSKMLVK